MRKIKLFNIKKVLRFNIEPPRQIPLGITHGDRKSWWTTYDSDLVNRISEIKRAQS